MPTVVHVMYDAIIRDQATYARKHGYHVTCDRMSEHLMDENGAYITHSMFPGEKIRGGWIYVYNKETGDADFFPDCIYKEK